MKQEKWEDTKNNLKSFADVLKLFGLKNANITLSKEDAKRILKKGADVSNFGDPIEWQKKDRTDRKINGL